ncbi:MAG: dTMP kinase [Sulfolobales archaeon]|nr:dTMP kinase [Sulfolobales archaeon]MDW8083252.1 dTMP kinase [Sulfolobales archaeon]
MSEIDLYVVNSTGSELKICGELLVYNRLLSPLGDIDTSTGRLRSGGRVSSKIVAAKGFTGSTVGPYVLYSLVKKGLAPRALIVEQIDVNSVTSAVISSVPLFRVGELSPLEKLYSEGVRYVCIEDSRLRPRGILVAIEGIDGAGKTTIAKYLFEILKKCGFRAIYTYEPYYNSIRAIFESRTMKLTPEAEALLMVADRYSHFNWVVREELKAGSVVILDRYKYSTVAYQGAVGLSVDWLREVQKYLPEPDIGIYLDIDPEEGLKRKAGNSARVLTYFEDLERLRKARKIYLDMVARGEMTLVDASLKPSEILEKIVDLIEEKLKLDLRECAL